MDQLMCSLRARPPTELAGYAVSEPLDFLTGAEQRSSYLGQADLLQFELAAKKALEPQMPSSGRLLVRPSGTEAKLKFYIHLRSNLSSALEYGVLLSNQARTADLIFSALKPNQRK